MTIRSSDDCALGSPRPLRLNPLQPKLGRRRSRELLNRVRARLSRPLRPKRLRRRRRSRLSVPALPTRRVIKMWNLRRQRAISHPPKNLESRANLPMMFKSLRVSEKSLLLTALTRVHSRTLHLEKHGHAQRQLIMSTRCFFHITTAAQLLRYPILIPQKSVLSYTDLMVFDEGIGPILFASAALGKHAPGIEGQMICIAFF